MNPIFLSLLICVAGAVLEGAAAGGGVRARFAELRLPPFSPPLSLWIGIGVAYYGMCFAIVWRLLAIAPPGAERLGALALMAATMIVNAGWGLLFFRLRNVRASYVAFFPYALLVAALGALLARIDHVGAYILVPYLVYLVYATWWARALWRLNDAKRDRVLSAKL